MDRRTALRQILRIGAAAAVIPGLGGCASRPQARRARSTKPDPRPAVQIDDGFARLVTEALRQPRGDLRARLLRHPAMTAMFRHQRRSGGRALTREGLLDEIVASARRAGSITAVLDYWTGRHSELAELIAAAAVYLPHGARFGGTVYLAAGYDIGVASPPDIVLNAAHPHFQSAPSELGLYALHEAHHVGFMAVRPQPELRALDAPDSLRSIIRYFTQLEGMAVHAAYRPRVDRGTLEADGDYRLYVDPVEAQRLTARYRALVGMLETRDRLTGDEIGTILGDMSSGERIWYRFGALVSWRLEQSRGIGALVESISRPALFDRTADALLAAVERDHGSDRPRARTRERDGSRIGHVAVSDHASVNASRFRSRR